ncbi:MAG: hypothetical protein NTW01_14810 [Gammaproteobacteria bacterium]|uniref:hypothetical protein n=1 Tax=Nevskia sp. TaxID=1929292 RepID=UPI0040353AB6|nr:hypothetical protein [Gammaproteobacteria bacterium]
MPPIFGHAVSIVEIFKDASFEDSGPKDPVESFDVRALGRLAVLDMDERAALATGWAVDVRRARAGCR